MLIDRAKTDGVYENFGQKEIRKIKDKFIDCCDYLAEMNNNRKKIEMFDSWCMEYISN